MYVAAITLFSYRYKYKYNMPDVKNLNNWISITYINIFWNPSSNVVVTFLKNATKIE